MKKVSGNHFLNIAVSILLLITLLTATWIANIHSAVMPLIPYIWMIVWLLVAVIFSFFIEAAFVPNFLITTFTMMIGWRISALYELTLISYLLFVVFILLFINFLYCVITNLRQPSQYKHAYTLSEWQLIFIRLYIGFDFIPHFTEKLFSGIAPRMIDIQAFMHLGVPDPVFFVWLAGLCELAAAIGVGLGLFMRLGALGAVVYLLIATYLGHHFSLGFIWAGGGWEYAIMWTVLIFSFVVTGFHAFSIDQYLEDKFKLPKWIKKIL
jgi:putative oxidoreductase